MVPTSGNVAGFSRIRDRYGILPHLFFASGDAREGAQMTRGSGVLHLRFPISTSSPILRCRAEFLALDGCQILVQILLPNLEACSVRASPCAFRASSEGRSRRPAERVAGFSRITQGPLRDSPASVAGFSRIGFFASGDAGGCVDDARTPAEPVKK